MLNTTKCCVNFESIFEALKNKIENVGRYEWIDLDEFYLLCRRLIFVNRTPSLSKTRLKFDVFLTKICSNFVFSFVWK